MIWPLTHRNCYRSKVKSPLEGESLGTRLVYINPSGVTILRVVAGKGKYDRSSCLPVPLSGSSYSLCSWIMYIMYTIHEQREFSTFSTCWACLWPRPMCLDAELYLFCTAANSATWDASRRDCRIEGGGGELSACVKPGAHMSCSWHCHKPVSGLVAISSPSPSSVSPPLLSS